MQVFEIGLIIGVQQGGLIPPVLYNNYIGYLHVKLTNSRLGCELERIELYNICYADDMVLVAPSVTALQNQVNMCEEYIAETDVVYNNFCLHAETDVVYNTTSFAFMLFCPTDN